MATTSTATQQVRQLTPFPQPASLPEVVRKTWTVIEASVEEEAVAELQEAVTGPQEAVGVPLTLTEDEAP